MNPNPNKHRYRKVALKMWGDDAFARLTPMPPSGQSLWIYLLACPLPDVIPGIYRTGRASLAEQLGWEIEDFDRCFNAITDLGMAKADWKSKLIWLPNAAKYNPPESPSVVVYWSKAWAEIPECELKSEIFEALKTHICAVGKGFAEAFSANFQAPPAPRGNKTGQPATDKHASQQGVIQADGQPEPQGVDQAECQADKQGVAQADKQGVIQAGNPDKHSTNQADRQGVPQADRQGVPHLEQEHIHEQEHNCREIGGVGERSSASPSPSAPSLQESRLDLSSKKPDTQHGLQASLDGGNWQPPAGGGDDDDDDVLEAVRESQTKTGTRLPPGYVVSAHWLSLAAKKRPDLPADQIKIASESFAAYWSAKPGKEGLKLNWLSTWLNWVRKERAPAAVEGRSGQARLMPPSPTPAGDPERERRMREFRTKYPGARFPAEDNRKAGG